jgi:hypothetical protein
MLTYNALGYRTAQVKMSLTLASTPTLSIKRETAPAKTQRTKQPHKNPNLIHQFTNSQIYKQTQPNALTETLQQSLFHEKGIYPKNWVARGLSSFG